MSYLRHVRADKGHVCPSTAVEGTDAIRLYTCSNRTRLRTGNRAAFYFTSNDSSKQALCPRTARPYLARRFYRNVFCLSSVARTERREPPTGGNYRSRDAKKKKNRSSLWYFFHHTFCSQHRERIPIYIISYYFASCWRKKKKGPFFVSFSLFFSLAQIIRIILGRKHFDVRWRFYSWIEEESVKIRCINRGKLNLNWKDG